MSDPLGRSESYKKRLKTLIENAVGGDPHFCHVSGEPKDTIRILSQLPQATLTFGVLSQSDQFYGNLLQSDNANTEEGSFYEQNFEVMCLASACAESEEESTRYVNTLADDIMDYLDQNRYVQTAYEIHDIYDLGSRPSNQGLPANVRRVIVDGKIWIRRTQTAYVAEGDTLPFTLA